MNRRIKIILDYTLLFIESILLFLLTLLLVINTTILNANYVVKKMDNTGYYNVLSDSIKTEMLYYTGQSGFKEDILDDTFSIDEIKEDSQNYIRNLYLGQKTNIDTSKFEKRLNKKIDDYLEEKDFKITNREEIDKFTSEMAKIYAKRIKIIDKLDNLAPKFSQVCNISNKILIVLSIGITLILLIHVLIFKRIKLSIILYTSSLLIVVLNIYIRNRIDLSHLYIYNEVLSNIVVNNANELLKTTMLLAIIYFILAIIIGIFMKAEKNK